MKFQKLVDDIKTSASVLVIFMFVGLCIYRIGDYIVMGWVNRNEQVYLISRASDPFWRKLGFIPATLVCYSPARCEPDGKPLPQYFVVLGESKVRAWGIDPAHEIPIIGYPY